MSKRRFISGKLRLDVSFNDRTGKYKVEICPTVRTRAERCETVQVGPPASGPRSAHGRRLAVDDPRALRNAAHAAISFARAEIADQADTNRRGSGWLIRPVRQARTRRR